MFPPGLAIDILGASTIAVFVYVMIALAIRFFSPFDESVVPRSTSPRPIAHSMPDPVPSSEDSDTESKGSETDEKIEDSELPQDTKDLTSPPSPPTDQDEHEHVRAKSLSGYVVDTLRNHDKIPSSLIKSAPSSRAPSPVAPGSTDDLSPRSAVDVEENIIVSASNGPSVQDELSLAEALSDQSPATEETDATTTASSVPPVTPSMSPTLTASNPVPVTVAAADDDLDEFVDIKGGESDADARNETL